ncbi:hypothetical protein ACFZBU_06745 [Embleya sp. NPDC008237]|uniref:hypothetical protein n=1 Tax=Embleya sp. NPDC008237 TaxID=3363978 RepID=UPI0036EC27B7
MNITILQELRTRPKLPTFINYAAVRVDRFDPALKGLTLSIESACSPACTANDTWNYQTAFQDAVLIYDGTMTWTGTDRNTIFPTWKMHAILPGTPTIPGNNGWGGGALQTVRCDDTAIRNSSGCVFAQYTPTLDLTDPKFGSSAAMIRFYQEHTIDRWGLKRANGSGKPLTRSPEKAVEPADKDWDEVSRKIVCDGTFVASPFPEGPDSCDEYPFAMATQSAGQGGRPGPDAVRSGQECIQVQAQGKVTGPTGEALYTSVKPIGPVDDEALCVRGHIPNNENKLVGSALAGLTTSARLSPRDPYWVDAGPPGWGDCDTFDTATPLSKSTASTSALLVCGPLLKAYNRVGGPSAVGSPVDTGNTADGTGRYLNLRRPGEPAVSGTIYWTPSTPASYLGGPVRDRWLGLGSEGGLGYPITDTAATEGGGGLHAEFSRDNTSIYWSASTGAHTISGEIRDKYTALRPGLSAGFPTADQSSIPGGSGRFVHLRSPGSDIDSASIYWSPTTGAHYVAGNIRTKWASLGWEDGLGFPTTDESSTPDGRGRFNFFSKDGNSIYWTEATGAHQVGGPIGAKWAGLGYEKGPGYPTTDETTAPDGVGRFNHFSNANNSIYWTPATGAHQIGGSVRDKWQATGWETGAGYPTTDTTVTPDGAGRYNHFRKLGATADDDSIYWHPQIGAGWIRDGIRRQWLQYGAEKASGYPVDQERTTSDGKGKVLYTSRIYNGGPALLAVYTSHPTTGLHWASAFQAYLTTGPDSWLGFPIKEPAYSPAPQVKNFTTLQVFQGGCIGINHAANNAIIALPWTSYACRSDYVAVTPETWNNRSSARLLDLDPPVALAAVLEPDGRVSLDRLKP